MTKFKSIVALVLCFVIVSASIPQKASAGIFDPYLLEKTMYVKKLNNKTLFSKLQTYPAIYISNENYRSNILKNNPIFIYEQDNVNLRVGESKFSDVGCEIAACYNATNLLEDPAKVNARKTVYLLPAYIKRAELSGSTMSINDNNIKSVLNYLADVYDSSGERKYDKVLFGIATPKMIFDSLNAEFGDVSKYKNKSSFGTDPYKIPYILSSEGIVKALNAYSYGDLNMSVNAALNIDKSFKVYIVSFWNYDTLNKCLDRGVGFHTICFYTKNGKLYSLNNAKNSSGPALETSLYSMIGGSEKYIVGYCITKQ